ncbi:hypothetical protein DESC_530013 [Desulfosarcina cetonica]|uniref:hypothetical protein n=1 Tax=Desulfosarcina cetonica TaxID=90730 RepID=UPI0006D0AFC3|nr:hypothetical protein [Desulfosarcina cetonica]VTR66899.1 hypothetical protein DESC_530013 [Desulfosarcina cetonica]
MKNAADIQDIFFYIAYIDKKLDALMAAQQQSVEILNAQDQLTRHGLDGFRERVIKESRMQDVGGFREHLSEIMLNDKELRHPHIKILNYLADQCDMHTGKFKEVHFSKIVEEARVGKNKAKGYLDLLDKGLVECRSDGYRVYFRIKWTFRCC